MMLLVMINDHWLYELQHRAIARFLSSCVGALPFPPSPSSRAATSIAWRWLPSTSLSLSSSSSSSSSLQTSSSSSLHRLEESGALWSELVLNSLGLWAICLCHWFVSPGFVTHSFLFGHVSLLSLHGTPSINFSTGCLDLADLDPSPTCHLLAMVRIVST